MEGVSILRPVELPPELLRLHVARRVARDARESWRRLAPPAVRDEARDDEPRFSAGDRVITAVGRAVVVATRRGSLELRRPCWLAGVLHDGDLPAAAPVWYEQRDLAAVGS